MTYNYNFLFSPHILLGSSKGSSGRSSIFHLPLTNHFINHINQVHSLGVSQDISLVSLAFPMPFHASHIAQLLQNSVSFSVSSICNFFSPKGAIIFDNFAVVRKIKSFLLRLGSESESPSSRHMYSEKDRLQSAVSQTINV